MLKHLSMLLFKLNGESFAVLVILVVWKIMKLKKLLSCYFKHFLKSSSQNTHANLCNLPDIKGVLFFHTVPKKGKLWFFSSHVWM